MTLPHFGGQGVKRKPTDDKVREDIDIVAKCKYLWTDGTLFPFDRERVLFVVLNDNVHGVPERVVRDIGNLKTVIVCSKESFGKRYTEYRTLAGHKRLRTVV